MNKCGYLTESLSSISQDKKSGDPVKEPNEIVITVESIENVDENKVKEVTVMVDFLGNILNQSQQTFIINSRADFDLISTINVQDISPQFMNEILANPVMFTVFDCTTTGSASLATSPPVEGKKRVSTSTSKSFMQGTTVLGMCNLDIGSLVTGEKRIKETLVLESENKLTPMEKVSWSKLPKLVVVASTGDKPLIPETTNRFNNVLGITLESVYNVPDYISEGTVFDACIQVPTIGDKTSRMKFPNGVTSSTKEFSCRKRWANISDMDGPGARSKYRILPHTCDVISSFPGKEISDRDFTKEQKTIRWDMWRSCLMLKTDVNYFYQKISKYSVWPVEIILPNKSKDQIPKEKSSKSDKKSKPRQSATHFNGDHFTAFLQLAPLLYPGETRVRVAAQLMTYSQADLVDKFGAEFSVLQNQSSVATVKGRTTSERSKASVRDLEEVKDGPGVPIFGPDGSPTFIVVEVELSKPLCQKRDLEYIEDDLKECLSIKGKLKKKVTNLTMVETNFSQSIMDAVSAIANEYQNYRISITEEPEQQIPDDVHFYEYFCKQKDFYKIRATLENQIVDLINEKCGAVDHFEEKLPKVYAYLVNEMHRVTNRHSTEQKNISFPRYNTGELVLYSEEALEECEYGLAREFLLLKLSRNTSNPDNWLDLAACYIRVNAIEMAIQAVREALYLDFYHQIGLLMYAVLMGYTSNPAVGKMAFEILLTKYPDFVEGWMILRLFYGTFGNTESGTVAGKQARILECEKNRPRKAESKVQEFKQGEFCMETYQNGQYQPAAEEKYGIGSFKNGMSWCEHLAWTTTICPPDNIRLRTVVLLLKLGFYQYATACLSEELLATGKEDSPSPALVYYTCVNYYLQGRYEAAIPLLQKHVKEYGQDCFIWSLLGHCYFKLQNHEKAIACYEYVIQSFNRPDDIHLVYSRMGFYYLEANKYPCAKHILKTACKHSPTPRLWKGVGISSLVTQDLDEADIAFTEANYLDNRDPETWAYLAITNALLRRLDLFKQCFLEARKRGLNNVELISKIKCFARLNGLTDEEFTW